VGEAPKKATYGSTMQWLNYHHLLYFWVVAKEGSIARASEQLRLAHPTISGQIHRLEEALDVGLFERKGRGLALTDAGRVAFRYADEIFSLGRDFLEEIKGRPSARPITLVVGVSDALAKSIVYRMLEPAFHVEDDVRVICRAERSTEALMGELAIHALDVILSDTPAESGSPVRAFSHPLGECGTVLFASPQLAAVCRRRFPDSLEGVAFLVPGAGSTLRRALDEWFDAHGVRPKIVAEVGDTALAAELGERGIGVFAAPDVVEKEIRKRHKVHIVGRTDVRQRFYAISLDRKLKHPAVTAICEVARKHIFG
jgi:LysR family transcriptional activator of nhaA